jgi:hypothetical protein
MDDGTRAHHHHEARPEMKMSTLGATMKTAKLAARHAVRLAMLAAAFTATANAEEPLSANTRHHTGTAHAKQVHRKAPQRSVRQSCDRRNSWLQNLLADKQCVDRAMAEDGTSMRSPNELPVLYCAPVQCGARAGATWVSFPDEITL